MYPLGYAVSFWATLYPAELLCTLWATLHPFELCCTLLSYDAAPYWVTKHPVWATLHLLSHATPFWAILHPSELLCSLWTTLHPSELSCTLLSYAAPFWAMLRPSELLCTLWATLHPTELLCTHRAALNPSELRCTLLIYAAPSWATVHPMGYAEPYWATKLCNLLDMMHPTEMHFILLGYTTPSQLICTLTEPPLFVNFCRMPECRTVRQSVSIYCTVMKRSTDAGTGIRRPSPVSELSSTWLKLWTPECRCRRQRLQCQCSNGNKRVPDAYFVDTASAYQQRTPEEDKLCYANLVAMRPLTLQTRGSRGHIGTWAWPQGIAAPMTFW
jgi:hypothetical protein